MKVTIAFAFLLITCSQFTFAQGSGCELIAENSLQTICWSYIVIDSRIVPNVTLDYRITLTAKRQNLRWFCGQKYGVFTWKETGKYANQIRVSFHLGIAHLSAYMCDDLSGPTRSGMRCSVDSVTSVCPGDKDSGSSCVYEEESFTSAEGKAKAGVETGGTISGVVRGKAKVSGTVIKRVTYNSKSYVVIPAGMRFCTSVEAVSEANSQAPTGYEWKCLASPKFSKEEYNGSCSTLTRCAGSLCLKKAKQNGGVKLAPSLFIVLAHILLVSTI